MSRDVSINKSEFAAYNHIAALVLVADKNGKIIFANAAVENILGYLPEEVLGQAWYELTDSSYLMKEKRLKVVSEMAKGDCDIKHRNLYESRLKAKDGSLIWTQWTNMLHETGLVIGVGQDITDKKKLKDSLIEKNQENELLLQEIHHRVKNNLQIISSLLNLQFENFEDDRLQKAIEKSKARIKSMALVHNMLHQSRDLSAIDFGIYLNDLTDSISKSYPCRESHKIDIAHCNAVFDVDLTINLGIIITELLSNVFDHAYEGHAEKPVSIKLRKLEDDSHQLVIQDMGKGMCMESIRNQNNPDTCFGLELVRSLCDQINGEMKLMNGQGTTADLRF